MWLVSQQHEEPRARAQLPSGSDAAQSPLSRAGLPELSLESPREVPGTGDGGALSHRDGGLCHSPHLVPVVSLPRRFRRRSPPRAAGGGRAAPPAAPQHPSLPPMPRCTRKALAPSPPRPSTSSSCVSMSMPSHARRSLPAPLSPSRLNPSPSMPWLGVGVPALVPRRISIPRWR